MSTVTYLAINTRYLDRISPAKIERVLPTITLVYFPKQLEHWSSKYLSKYELGATMIFRASLEQLPKIVKGLDELEYCGGLGSMPSEIKIMSPKVLMISFDTESG